MTDLQYPVAVIKVSEEDGGGYLAQAVDLKGCIGDGETPEEAIANLRDAIIEWIDEARRLERPIPLPGQAIANAHKKHQEMIGVIRKQDELIGLQAESFEHLRREIAHLREQIAELADKNGQDEGDQIWGCSGDIGLISVKKAPHGDNGIPH